jgi:hypothetical protein
VIACLSNEELQIDPPAVKGEGTVAVRHRTRNVESSIQITCTRTLRALQASTIMKDSFHSVLVSVEHFIFEMLNRASADPRKATSTDSTSYEVLTVKLERSEECKPLSRTRGCSSQITGCFRRHPAVVPPSALAFRPPLPLRPHAHIYAPSNHISSHFQPLKPGPF